MEFHITRSLVIERGAAAKLAERVGAMGCKAVLVVTDRGVLSAGLLAEALLGFDGTNLRVAIFSDVEADPAEAVVHAGIDAARRIDADCVIGFGGGSSMDVAKLIALLVRSGESLEDVYGVERAGGPRLPLVLIPTTAGTGSEVTPISIVTTGASEKKAVVSSLLLPDVAVLDATLTIGLPAHVTAATGIDAMVHAIEAYTSKRLKNVLSDCLAREAIRLLSKNFHAACEDGNDLEAREAMLTGACLAGMAFANAPVAAVHALAYPLGARFHVSHGLSNSLVLGPVLRFNLEAALPLYAELAEVVLPGVTGTPRSKADALLAYLSSLAGSVGLPTRLRDVGVARVDIEQLATDAMKQTRLLTNNPRAIDLEHATALYLEAL